ncbi:hypothetical protein FD25_GL002043 [Levilactobacillus acidifarinae DSM 19394]|uniref:Uncharacterized protein n=1 Tax=Levilactobacillus acidifarinae DSM 19394 = JCM 15949 TaxID=1423715 RepID=A0A0R1LW79_9LACO|nr:hypothetical protein FD25_GL002043 [Levilactobacillus acidifarinae DSM 19394]
MNKIVEIVDVEIPEFLKSHRSITERNPDFVKEINKYRHQFIIKLQKKLDID